MVQFKKSQQNGVFIHKIKNICKSVFNDITNVSIRKKDFSIWVIK